MCRPYHVDRNARELARQFRLRMDVPLPNFEPSWRVATTDPAPVVRRHPESGERRLDVLRWGLVPHWTKEPARALRPVNARSDTVSTSSMFRAAYRERRCLVPTNGWYEWQKQPDGRKQAHAFARLDEQPMAFAGIWESVRWPDGEVLRTFTIVTTEPSPEGGGDPRTDATDVDGGRLAAVAGRSRGRSGDAATCVAGRHASDMADPLTTREGTAQRVGAAEPDCGLRGVRPAPGRAPPVGFGESI